MTLYDSLDLCLADVWQIIGQHVIHNHLNSRNSLFATTPVCLCRGKVGISDRICFPCVGSMSGWLCLHYNQLDEVVMFTLVKIERWASLHYRSVCELQSENDTFIVHLSDRIIFDKSKKFCPIITFFPSVTSLQRATTQTFRSNKS